jgi:acyl carrier protein
MKVKYEDIIAAIQQAKVIDGVEGLRSNIKLTEQGIDSLGMFSVILVLQEKYEIDIPDADIDKLSTISELMVYIEDKLNNG